MMAKNNGLVFDGNSWKDKDSKTYTSILDLYGISEIFSEEKNNLYEKKKEEDRKLQGELEEYIFSDFSSEERIDDELTNYIFSEEIDTAKVKSYDTENKNNLLYIWGIGIIVAMIFIVILNKYNRNRKKRRVEFATEINMESFGAK